MPSILHGRIVYRFRLPCPESKARRLRTAASGDNNKDERCLVDNSLTQENHCGFIFIASSKTKPRNEYLLSLPKRLLKIACHAVRLERKVAIKRYKEIPFLESSSTFEESKDSIPSSSPPIGYSLVEVYDMEIILDRVQDMVTTARKHGRNDSVAIENVDNLWTLTQFWRKERLDFQKMKNSRPKFSLVATIDAISPIVTLDPSNPFALIEVYDMENTDVTCVVVLHGRQAMINHAAIQPLETLIFRDVVYKPWAVHKVLYDEGKDKGSDASTSYHQFLGRIPSHVFVATQADSIFWGNENSSLKRQISSGGRVSPSSRHQLQSKRGTPKFIPPIITPINLMTSIEGKILSVKTRSISLGHSKARVIHYLELSLLNWSTVEVTDSKEDNVTNGESPTTRSRCRLYLSHFPMSVAIQCSLRKGGVVQAWNVHLICSHQRSSIDNDIDNTTVTSYGACLRSTLNLLQHASDVNISSVEETGELGMKSESISSFSTQPRKPSSNSLNSKSFPLKTEMSRKIATKDFGLGTEYHFKGLPSDFLNYGFRKVKQSYLQDLYLQHVEDWERRGFQTSTGSTANLIPRRWITNVLLDCNRNTRNLTKTHGVESIPKKNRKKTSNRSPYAEFFQHSFSFPLNYDGENSQGPSSSCRKNTSLRCSALLGLNWIRTASQNYFENHILRLLQSTAPGKVKNFSQLRKGFHGSIRVSLSKLSSENWKEKDVQEAKRDEAGSDGQSNNGFFVGGFVGEVHSLNSSVASIADGVCQIPISCGKSKSHTNIDDFLIGQFDSVIISCLCLGHFAESSEREHSDKNQSISDSWSLKSKSISLPALHSRESGLLGNCTLATIGEFMFITAIQIHCHDCHVHKVTAYPFVEQDEIDLEKVTLKVENCLVTQDWLSESFKSKTVLGTLTRCEFFSKVSTDGSRKCCLLTISSLKERSKSDKIESDNSCLQAVELTISIAQNTARMVKLNEMLSLSWRKAFFSGSQKAQASAFWVLGGSGRTCALTFGGSDDFVPGSSCSAVNIKVTFPASSLQWDKLGYVRSLCAHNCLDAFFESGGQSGEGAHASDAFAYKMSSESFDFIGGTKAIAGMLHRRPARRTIFRSDVPPLRIVGELSTTCSDAIPLNSLSDLFESIIQCLRGTTVSRSSMNPSLVRRISNGRFLGVSFCQVQCYCTRCFRSLTGPPLTPQHDATMNRKRKLDNSFDEPSFWHFPHPKDSNTGIHSIQPLKCAAVADPSTVPLPQHIRSSKLRCPKNDCPKHVFGVRWECSGVLDDGTGQATLYADGDAALTLLGMSAETIQTIEEGVWSVRDGSIQFMKSIPPPKTLRDKVLDILATQRRDDRRSKSCAMVDPFGMLSKQDRATYLLDRHCRSSNQPRRQLDYYVRCKPIVNKGNAPPHLHHSTIESFFEEGTNDSNERSTIYRGQIATYAIPSLKLELVDCGVDSNDFHCTKF